MHAQTISEAHAPRHLNGAEYQTTAQPANVRGRKAAPFDPDLSTLPGRIDAMLMARGDITRREFDAAVKLAPGWLTNRHKAGTTRLYPATVKRITRFLQCSSEWLLDGPAGGATPPAWMQTAQPVAIVPEAPQPAPVPARRGPKPKVPKLAPDPAALTVGAMNDNLDAAMSHLWRLMTPDAKALFVARMAELITMHATKARE